MAKILIIDDDRIVCDALFAFLTRAGYEVSCVGDGLNAVQSFKLTRPDLVILDRDLPGLSGSKVYDAIRKVDRDTPVLVLSGYDDPAEVDAYLRHGASAFLSKSGGLSAVLDKVDELLAAAGKAAAPAAKAHAPAPAAKPAAAAQPAGAEPRRKPLLLIADDEPAMRRLLKRFAESNGWEAALAEDGIQAETMALTLKPDIVLLDIFMPGKSGADVLASLTAALPAAGIMMITGNDDEVLARHCLQAGAFDYISKPINLETLAGIIKARLLLQS